MHIRIRLAFGSCGIAVLALGALGGFPTIASAVAPFPVVGHLAVGPHAATSTGSSGDNGGTDYAQSRLLLDVPARRGYQLIDWSNAIGINTTEITEFDLDTLTALRRVEIDGVAAADLQNATGDIAKQTFPAALAPASSGAPRLFFIADMLSTRPGVNGHDLVVVDLRQMQISADIPLHSVTQQCLTKSLATEQCPTFGLAYDVATDMVYATTADSEVGTGGLAGQSWQLSIRAVSLRTGIYASASLPASCTVPLNDDAGIDAAPVYRSPDGATLWTACSTGTASSDSGGVVAAAVAIPLVPATGFPDPNRASQVLTVSGNAYDAFADPAGNRISFLNLVNGDHNLRVVDGANRSVVGDTGLDPEIVYTGSTGTRQNDPSRVNDGVDPSTGRVYHASERGMYLVDGRRTSRQGFPQGTTEPLDGGGKYAFAPIAIDYMTRHVFVQEAYNGTVGPSLGGPSVPDYLDTAYTVYQDNVPVSRDVSLAGIDSNTDNIPLVPGATVAIYSGHAQGFGSRTFDVNPSYIGGSIAQGTCDPTGKSGICAGGVRDTLFAAATTVAGQSGGPELSNGSATAVGMTSDADATTQSEYTTRTNQPYPFLSHACDDSSGTKATASSTNDPGGSTQESCDLSKGAVTVSSVFRSSEAASGAVPAASPSESDVTSTVTYVPNQATSIGAVPAVVSTSTATVQGIQLAADVSVSYLQITATSVAGGRSGTASHKVTLTIRGVKAGTFDCPTSCDPSAALQQINSALQVDFPNQVTVTFPTFDANAAAGTPKGYFDAVYKDTYQLLNDSTIDYNSRQEWVGMEEIRNNDAVFLGSTSRQITDFAGVEVESRFGITPLDLGFPIVGSGVITAGTSIPGTPGSAGQFVPGTPAGQGSANNGATGSGRSGNGGPLAAIVNGLAFLLDWTQLPLMSLMWIVLLLPAYLATRRQRLEALAL